MTTWTVAAPILIVVGLLSIDVLCGDVSYVRNVGPSRFNNTNAWPKLPGQQQNPLPAQVQPQWGPLRQTTPWPALGQQRPYRPSFAPQDSNPTWNRPNTNQRYNHQQPTHSQSHTYQSNRGDVGPQFGNTGEAQQPYNGPQRSGSNGNVEDNELREFSEVLLTKDTNNAAKYVTARYQGRTTSRSDRDEAPAALLVVDTEAYKIPSVKKLVLLYDNYEIRSNVKEDHTSQERTEENGLLDTVIATPVMAHTRNFLIEKGVIGRDPREFKDVLGEIWFNMYSRGGGKVGSSGFEHVFLAEIKKNQVSGLHNWIYFGAEEEKNKADYLGYLKKIDLGDKGSILKYHFKFDGIDKPVGSMFIGTSPEFEMALYTTCFLLRADKICPLKLNGNRFIIRTYTYTYQGKKLIGSAFPEI